MIRWVVLWQACSLLLISATMEFNIFSARRRFGLTPQIDCFEIPDEIPRKLTSSYDSGWRNQKKLPTIMIASASNLLPTALLKNPVMTRRGDSSLLENDDIVKEHAKLVQDINSLKETVFVAPLADKTKDYDDSIYYEIIETTTTTTPRPYITKKKPGTIPIILLGDASQRAVIKSQPLKFLKPTVNLVGTTASPIAKHPYPFVMQTPTFASSRPVRVCVRLNPNSLTSTEKPSLLDRLLKGIISR